MRRRVAAATLLGVVAMVAGAAHAQTAAAVPEVCVIHPGERVSAQARIMPQLAAGLREKRIELGRDAVLVWLGASFAWDRLPALAADCVARRARVIAPISPIGVAAARAATRTIPIVAHDLETDPVAAGIVAGLARPGGNLTGVYFDFPDFGAKWLELVAEALPGAPRIGLLWDPATGPSRVAEIRSLAAARGVTLIEQEMPDLASVDARFRAFVGADAQAVLLLSSPLIGANPALFAAAAKTHLLPAITMYSQFAEAGGLMAYGPDLQETFHPLGELIGKILRGADPGTLPIDRPSRLRLVVNLTTAKALGVTLSPSLLGRADEVIE